MAFFLLAAEFAETIELTIIQYRFSASSARSALKFLYFFVFMNLCA